MSDSLEIAHDLLLKFGNGMGSQLPAMAEAFLLSLSDSRSSTRKKATHCLGVRLCPHTQGGLNLV